MKDDATEIRAKVLTFQSRIHDNAEGVASVSHYKDLVHGAWNQTMSLKKDFDLINQTVLKNTESLQKEAIDRENTDNLLMELFQSVLHILSNDVDMMQNLEKKGEQVERANVQIMQSKVDKEFETTKKVLDSHAAQLSAQKVQLLDFNVVETKLNDIEFRLSLEMAKSENLTQYINSKHFQSSDKIDKIDEIIESVPTVVTPILPMFNITEIDEMLQIEINQLETNITFIISGIREEMIKIWNVTELYDATIATIVDEQTALWQDNSDIKSNITDILLNFDAVKDYADNILINSTTAVAELAQLALAQNDILSNMTEDIAYLDVQLQNVTQQLAILQVEQIFDESKDEIIDQLVRTVAALRYGYDTAPEVGEIMITGGDGEYGAVWDSVLVSTEYKAKRTFADMNLARSSHCLVKFEDHVYAVGGAWDSVSILNKRNEWRDIDPMLESRDLGPGCAVFNNRMWVCGGHDGSAELSTCESYHPSDGWQFEADLLVEISQTTAVVNSAGLFVIGGSNTYGDAPFVQFYDQDVHLWRLWEDLPLHVADGRAVEVDDQIYMVGGSGGNEQNILHLNMTTQEWTLAGEFSNEHVGAAVVAIDHEVWVFGGELCFDDECGNEVEVFDTYDYTTRKHRIKNMINVNYGAAIVV